GRRSSGDDIRSVRRRRVDTLSAPARWISQDRAPRGSVERLRYAAAPPTRAHATRTTHDDGDARRESRSPVANDSSVHDGPTPSWSIAGVCRTAYDSILRLS